MRVLITNNRLDYRGGAEAFVRDLAQGLQSRGHTVMAYTSSPEQCERLMENDGIPVCVDLEKLKFQPDIIHGQHHLDTMTALLSLPGVPAVYHCHGAVWTETQPRHPRIYRYLAMSRTLKERMLIETGLPEKAVEVVLNGVHTGRFRMVRPAPERLKRALFYNGHHRPDSPTLEAIEKACRNCGLELEFAGKHLYRRINCPERELPGYDLVFAGGKSAIDALACGCAVVILGRNSCGELVTLENFDRYRQVNFSVAANCPPPSLKFVEDQIRRYNAETAGAVTQRVRTECTMDEVVDRLELVYAGVIDIARRQPLDPEAEIRAAGAYLRRLVPVIKLLRENQEDAGVSVVTLDVLQKARARLEELQVEMDRLF